MSKSTPPSKPVPATLQDWITANRTRSWESNSRVSSFAATKATTVHTVRLKQDGKTVSIGTGPSKPIAIQDALTNLPSTWR